MYFFLYLLSVGFLTSSSGVDVFQSKTSFDVFGKTFDSKDKLWHDSNKLFVQMKPKPLVALYVDGQALLLPETSVELTCPLKMTQSPGSVTWKKNGEMITNGQKFHLLDSGALFIPKSDVNDSGSYVCCNGTQEARLMLAFHSIESAKKLHDERVVRSSPRGIRRKRQALIAGENDLVLTSEDPRHGFWDDSYDYSYVPYKFIVSDWGPCSTKGCDGVGFQIRNTSCELIYDWYFRSMEEEMCTRHGLRKPEHERKCNEETRGECPKWRADEWSECYCSDNGDTISQRDVQCTLNDQPLPDGKCGTQPKPDKTRRCDKTICQAEWTAGVWSGCSRSCGGQGVRLRLIQCRWKHNSSLAFVNQCTGEKPRSMITCATPPCEEEACIDQSSYCSFALRRNMCRFSYFHQRCCRSCTRHAASPGQSRGALALAFPRTALLGTRRATSIPPAPPGRGVPFANRVLPWRRTSSRNSRDTSRQAGSRHAFVQPLSSWYLSRNDVNPRSRIRV